MSSKFSYVCERTDDTARSTSSSARLWVGSTTLTRGESCTPSYRPAWRCRARRSLRISRRTIGLK
jgi:hypothetical protein